MYFGCFWGWVYIGYAKQRNLFDVYHALLQFYFWRGIMLYAYPGKKSPLQQTRFLPRNSLLLFLRQEHYIYHMLLVWCDAYIFELFRASLLLTHHSYVYIPQDRIAYGIRSSSLVA